MGSNICVIWIILIGIIFYKVNVGIIVYIGMVFIVVNVCFISVILEFIVIFVFERNLLKY